MQLAPGVGPYLPQGAAKAVCRKGGNFRGPSPKQTNVFQAQTVFEPTVLQTKYHNGDLPCKMIEEDKTIGEDKKVSGGRRL